MRVVVVGAGVVGLLTAMECARAGATVTVADRDDVPSPHATSYDRQRVVRSLHAGDAALTGAAAAATAAWLDVERRLDTRCYRRVGALTAVADVAVELGLLVGAGVAATAVPGGELAVRYPQVRFPPGAGGVLETAAGVVLADRALAAVARWLRGRPAVRLLPRCRITEVDDAAVRSADGTVLPADRVVVAAGPWSRELVPDAVAAGVTLFRQSVLSYAPPPSAPPWAGIPTILGLGARRDAWLMPPVGGAPARLSSAGACRAVDAMADRAAPAAWRDQLVEQFRGLLTGFDPGAVVGATDGYYLAAAGRGGPLLATNAAGTVWSYAACGGMSFKFAPLVARALADRALGRPPRPTGIDAVDQPRQPAVGRTT